HIRSHLAKLRPDGWSWFSSQRMSFSSKSVSAEQICDSGSSCPNSFHRSSGVALGLSAIADLRESELEVIVHGRRRCRLARAPHALQLRATVAPLADPAQRTWALEVRPPAGDGDLADARVHRRPGRLVALGRLGGLGKRGGLDL